jgi:UDP:flavonoid glycosyltransferase YjiC (YdhE family)
MLDAYNAARVFIQPQPSMPMPRLHNSVTVGPIARIGRNRREEIMRLIGASADDRLILIAPGGIPMTIDMTRWPRLPHTRYLVEAAWRSTHPDAVTIQSLKMPFPDVLASCDVFIGKPGYGSFAEAACNGVPVLYLPRGDWPEEPYLVDWLQRVGRCKAISRAQLVEGHFSTPINEVLALPQRGSVAPTGIEQTSKILAGIMTNI